MPEEISTQPQSHNEMSRAVPLFALGLILTTVGFGVGYWYGVQEAKRVETPTQVSGPTPTPTPAPAPGKIAFVKDGDIWIINPDGNGEQILKDDLDKVPTSVDRKLKWSPDGKFLSWIYEKEESAFHTLHTLGIKTGTVGQVLATGACCSIIDYVWSPNGSQVAIIHTDKAGGGPPGFFLSVFNINAASDRDTYLEIGKLGPTELLPQRIVWQEDKILVLSKDGEMLAVKPDGTDREIWLLTDSGFEVGDSDLSPNATQLAYISTSPDGISSVYIMDLESRVPKLIASNLGSVGGKSFQKVKWSPDGKYLVLESALIDTGGVEVLDLSGNVLHQAQGDPQLLFDEVYQEEKPAQWSWSGFDWSPDSKGLLRVIYIVYPRGLPGLIVKYDLETGQLTKITTTDSFISPVWSPAFDF